MDESPYCWAAWSMLVLVLVVCAGRRVSPVWSTEESGPSFLHPSAVPPSPLRHSLHIHMGTRPHHWRCPTNYFEIVSEISYISSKTKAFELPSSLQQIQSIHGRIIPSSIWCDAEMHNYICH